MSSAGGEDEEAATESQEALQDESESLNASEQWNGGLPLGHLLVFFYRKYRELPGNIYIYIYIISIYNTQPIAY